MRTGGNVWRWWMCLWHRLCWWFHTYMLISRLIKLYTLHMYSFLYVSPTSIKWFKKKKKRKGTRAEGSEAVHCSPQGLSRSVLTQVGRAILLWPHFPGFWHIQCPGSYSWGGALIIWSLLLSLQKCFHYEGTRMVQREELNCRKDAPVVIWVPDILCLLVR